jgi:hypothetical protein
VDRPGELVAAPAEGAEHDVEVVHEPGDQLAALVERGRQRGRSVREPAEAVEDLAQPLGLALAAQSRRRF